MQDKKETYLSGDKEDGYSLISETLKNAIDSHKISMQDYTELRTEAIKLYCGRHYNKALKQNKMLVNYLDQLIVTYESLLTPTTPHCEITSRVPGGKLIGKDLAIAVEDRAENCEFVREVNKAIVDALFCMGIIKVGRCLTDYIDGVATGESFIKRVSLNNYFCDLDAKDETEMQFQGDDYYVTSEWLKENYDYDATEAATEYRQQVAENEDANISRDQQGLTSYKTKILLRDVFLPQDKRFITYVVETGVILVDNQWEAEFSPYKTLGFRWVPDNIIPLSPIAVIFSLALKSNELLLKCYAQGHWQKNVTVFSNGDQTAAGKFTKSRDGDAISANGNAKPNTLGTMGVQQPTFMLSLKLADLVSEGAGGLQTLGGYGAETETAKQEGIVNENANIKVKNMSKKTETFIQEIYEALAYFTYDDPEVELDLEKRVPNTDITIPIKWNIDRTDGPYEQWKFEFEIIAEPDNSSNGKLKRLLSVMNEVIMPTYEILQQAGGSVDMEEFYSRVAKWTQLPEVNNMVLFNGQPMRPQPGATGNASRFKAPGQDEHVYTHKSSQGAKQGAKDMAHMMKASGMESQPSEEARMFE